LSETGGSDSENETTEAKTRLTHVARLYLM
jgi:hypothetical protein